MNETEMTGGDRKSVEMLQAPMTELRLPVGAGVSGGLKVAKDPVWVSVGHVLLIALLACVGVWHGWEKGRVLAPTDGLSVVAPWGKAGELHSGANEQLMDQTAQFVPWMIYTKERYEASVKNETAQWPLWNPYSGTGAPFIANGQSAVFYPTVLLHLKLPETWSWTISAAVRLFLAGLGTWVMAGRYGLGGWARLLPAVGFMFCGFNVVWLNHPQMNVMPLLPWAVLMVELLMSGVTLLRVLLGALVFGVQFLGGHPATSIHLLLCCFIVVVWRVFSAGKVVAGARALAVGAAVGFGFALAAAQWLPLIEYVQNSGASVVRKEKLANEKLFAFDPRYLIGVAFPYANGYPDGVSPFEIRQVTHLPNTNEIAPGWVGTVPLLLAILGMGVGWRSRLGRMWVVIVAVAILIAIRFPGVDHVVRFVPGLNVAQNARLLGVAALGLAILSGFGLAALTSGLWDGVDFSRMRKWTGRLAVGLGVIAIVGAGVLYFGKNAILKKGYAKAEASYQNSNRHEHSIEFVRDQVERVRLELLITCARLGWPVGMLGITAGLLWWNRRRGWGSVAARGWVWVSLATVELLAFAIPFNAGAWVESYYPQDVAAIAKLKELPAARIAGTFRTMIPESSTAYGLADIRGYDALAPLRYYKWWDHEKIGALRPEMQGYISRLDNPEHPAWGLLNFGYLVQAVDQPAPSAEKFKPVISGAEDAYIYQATTIRPRVWVAGQAEVLKDEDAVLDRVAKMDFDPDTTVLLDENVAWDQRELVKAEPSVWESRGRATAAKAQAAIVGAAKAGDDMPEVVRVNVSNCNGGYLVLADSYFPGWSATIVDERGAGKEAAILPAYGVLRAVALPASGNVKVEFRYRPWSWRIGGMVSLCSVCLFLVLLGAGMIGQKFSTTDGE